MKRNWAILILSALAENLAMGATPPKTPHRSQQERSLTHFSGSHATILTVAASTDAAPPMLD
jgi:hypothetical protein